MGKLFPGVPKIKNDPKRIAVLNPSIYLGFVPLVGGAITTPMQLGEIDRANDWQSAADHFVKLLAVRSMRKQLADSVGKPVAASVAVSRPEIRQVVQRHMKRRELLNSLARRRFTVVSMRPPLERRAIASRFRVHLPIREPVVRNPAEVVQRPAKFRPNRRSV